jgi:glycosyltransferase involved in cell wall biosynthesis
MVCLASIGIGVKKMFHTLHSDPQKTSYGLHVYVDRFCYKLFNVRTLALNQEMKEKADLLFHLDNTLVLRNGIDIESYSNQPRIELRQDFGIPVDCFVLGHVGRFNKVKNHTKIIDVFKEIKKSKPLSKLLLVGDGEEMGRIREKVNSYSLSDDVIFTGSRNDVPQMMAMMDCFIFPSLYEGLGIVLLEAQAAGLKCVVADTVPQETTVTDKVFRLPLDCDSEIWASTALGRNDLKPAPINQSIEAYDISNVIATLKEYYECE